MTTASVIRVKRSSGTLAPSTLYTGELAYSVGGGRFYVGGLGTGSDLNGSDGAPILIGGNNFSFLDSVTAGTLTASKALVVDGNSKIDILNVDNIRLDLNTISTTNGNGNLILAPEGSGSVFVDASTLRVGDNNVDAVITTNGTGNLTLSTNEGSNSGTIVIIDGADQNITITPNGTGKIVLDGQSWPNAIGSADTYLKTDASGNLSWAAVPSGVINLAGDTGTDAYTTGETLTFTGTDPVNTAVTDNTVTISVSDATTTTKGIASFNSTYFSVTTGAVSINDEYVQDTVGAMVSSNSETNISVTYDDTNGKLDFSVAAATTTTLGVASFSSDNFAVTDGAVTIKDGGVANAELVNSTITLGSSTLTLGATTTDIAGLTSLVVDDLNINGSTISAVNAGLTDINVTLTPKGAGTVDVSSKRITSVADPVGAQDAATKAYVDAVKTGLDVKDSVRVATTAALTVTYNNGAGTLTNAGTQAAITIDSIPLSQGDRVLVKNQTSTDAVQNGIYTVTTVGTVSTNWVLTRAVDFDSTAEITGGAFTFVEEGTANADNGFVLTTNGTVTLGTTELTFVQFSGAGQIVDGDGLLKSGNTLSVRVDNTTIEITSDILNVKDAGITYAKIQNVDALSVVGRASNTAGVADEITATAAYQVLRASTDGTSIGFGAITLSQSNAVTGTLAVGNGGTGLSTLTQNGVFYASDTSTVAQTAAGTNGYILYSNSGVPAWTNIIDGGTFAGV